MSTWSKGLGMSRGMADRLPGVPMVSALQYRDLAAQLPPTARIASPGIAAKSEPVPQPEPAPEVAMTHAELETLLAKTRAEATTAAEARLQGEYSALIQAEKARIGAAVERFERDRRGYFSKVETEVVRLALSIAAKILHREAQVDPMLVAALVQIAVNQLKENSAVNVRVAPAVAEQWRRFFGSTQQWASVTVVEDQGLLPGDCLLETELGSANFSLAAQLKEVEQGFFDVLSHTPRD